jgi:hypothetical protein
MTSKIPTSSIHRGIQWREEPLIKRIFPETLPATPWLSHGEQPVGKHDEGGSRKRKRDAEETEKEKDWADDKSVIDDFTCMLKVSEDGAACGATVRGSRKGWFAHCQEHHPLVNGSGLCWWWGFVFNNNVPEERYCCKNGRKVVHRNVLLHVWERLTAVFKPCRRCGRDIEKKNAARGCGCAVTELNEYVPDTRGVKRFFHKSVKPGSSAIPLPSPDPNLK